MKKLIILLMFISTPLFSITRNVAPNVDGEASIGTSPLHWGKGYINHMHISSVTWADGSISTTASSGGGSTFDPSALGESTGTILALVYQTQIATGTISGGGGVSVYPATSPVQVSLIQSTATGVNVFIASTTFTGNVTIPDGTFTMTNGSATIHGNLYIGGSSRFNNNIVVNGTVAGGFLSSYDQPYSLSTTGGTGNKLYLGHGGQSIRDFPIVVTFDTGTGTTANSGMTPFVFVGANNFSSDYGLFKTTTPTVYIFSNRTLKPSGIPCRVTEYGKMYHDGNNFVIASGSCSFTANANNGGIGIMPNDTSVNYSTWTASGIDLVGAVYPTGYTKAVLATMTPIRAGGMVYVSDDLDVWVSTGNLRGQWKNARTGGGF